jgi:hypothetical protein
MKRSTAMRTAAAATLSLITASAGAAVNFGILGSSIGGSGKFSVVASLLPDGGSQGSGGGSKIANIKVTLPNGQQIQISQPVSTTHSNTGGGIAAGPGDLGGGSGAGNSGTIPADNTGGSTATPTKKGNVGGTSSGTTTTSVGDTTSSSDPTTTTQAPTTTTKAPTTTTQAPATTTTTLQAPRLYNVRYTDPVSAVRSTIATIYTTVTTGSTFYVSNITPSSGWSLVSVSPAGATSAPGAGMVTVKFTNGSVTVTWIATVSAGRISLGD